MTKHKELDRWMERLCIHDLTPSSTKTPANQPFSLQFLEMVMHQGCRTHTHTHKNLPTLLSSATPSSWCPWRRRSISGSAPRSFSDASFQPPSCLSPDVWWPSGSSCAVSVLHSSQSNALQQKHTWGASSCWLHIFVCSCALQRV